MKRSARIVPLVALLMLAPLAFAKETRGPCKNHYILDEPCGQAWRAANSGLADLDVHVVAVDPVDRNTLFAGGPSGLFKSVDAGTSWNPTGLALVPETVAITTGPHSYRLITVTSRVVHMAIDPGDPKRVYASVSADNGCVSWQRRLYKSADGGASWDVSASLGINGCDNIHSLQLGGGTPAVLYATDYDDAMGDTWSPLVRSSDAAESWDYYVGDPMLNVLAIDPSEPLTLYAGSFDFAPYYTTLPNGVLKSADGGITWSPTGLVGTGITALALEPGRPRTIYAAAAHGIIEMGRGTFAGVFKSTNGGASWIAADAGLDSLAGAQSTVVSMIVDPADPNIVYLGMSRSGVWRSLDGGATWQPFNDGLENLTLRSLAMARGKPNALYAGTDSGVFSIIDPGQ